MTPGKVDAQVRPEGVLEVLSRHEVTTLRDSSNEGLHKLFRRCALAVLNSGQDIPDIISIAEAYRDFDIDIITEPGGIKLQLRNAPGHVFVNGQMIRNIKNHLFAVLRDIVFINDLFPVIDNIDRSTSESLTEAVFHILRNSGILKPTHDPRLVVCWGGHSIPRHEYDYTKSTGHQLGLRNLNICTGCGPGAMKGPMKGATLGHNKQRITDAMYLGLTEPGIIGAEPPNAFVNELVILPDIEKRLEAFVRLGHGFVVFPGGVGTCEEILYLMAVLLDERNAGIPFPLVFTGPAESAPYFEAIDAFLRNTLGDQVASFYRIIIDDAEAVADYISDGVAQVREHRKQQNDAYYFNWQMQLEIDLQLPFAVTHASVAALRLHRGLSPREMAITLRRIFSSIVTANVKAEGIALVKRDGPFAIHADQDLIRPIENLLDDFLKQGRMKMTVHHSDRPAYRVEAIH